MTTLEIFILVFFPPLVGGLILWLILYLVIEVAMSFLALLIDELR